MKREYLTKTVYAHSQPVNFEKGLERSLPLLVMNFSDIRVKELYIKAVHFYTRIWDEDFMGSGDVYHILTKEIDGACSYLWAQNEGASHSFGDLGVYDPAGFQNNLMFFNSNVHYDFSNSRILVVTPSLQFVPYVYVPAAYVPQYLLFMQWSLLITFDFIMQ